MSEILKDYCVYLTSYSGNKLPPFYIGSSSIKRIKLGYKGTVVSFYKSIWEEEIKKTPHLFKTFILSTHETRQNAYLKEAKLQRKLHVLKNELYLNRNIANEKFIKTRTKHSEITKKKIGLKSKQNKNYLYARKWLEENKDLIRKKLSKTRKGKCWKPPKLKENNIIELCNLYNLRPHVGFIGRCPRSGQNISYERAFAKKYAKEFLVTPNQICNILQRKCITWNPIIEKILD